MFKIFPEKYKYANKQHPFKTSTVVFKWKLMQRTVCAIAIIDKTALLWQQENIFQNCFVSGPSSVFEDDTEVPTLVHPHIHQMSHSNSKGKNSFAFSGKEMTMASN